ncbi:hypothetical protein MOUN0_F01486 [Monosporozyma unispora]|nr:hypothetical protein C6P44_003818 [Kazachstania unispora]
MLSHVVEYSCQYSDQVRKKQKIWHDGKLKYFQINNRFMLYTEDNVMLSSSFVTNSKEVSAYLDEEGFEITEHKIFGSFVIVINEIIAEYDREIRHIKTTTAPSFTNNKNLAQSNDNVVSVHHVQYPDKMVLKNSTEHFAHSKATSSTPLAKKPSSNMTRLNSMSPVVKKEQGGGMTSSGLALKFNKPFKPPRMANSSKTSNTNIMNRPTIRNAKVKEENKNTLPSPSIVKSSVKSNDELLISKNSLLKKPIQSITPQKELVQPKKNVVPPPKLSQKVSSRLSRTTFKPRVITHKPIVLPRSF